MANTIKKPWWRIIVGVVGGGLFLLTGVNVFTTIGLMLGVAIHYSAKRTRDKGRFIFRDCRHIYRHPSKLFVEINVFPLEGYEIVPAKEDDLDAMIAIAEKNYFGTIREIIGEKERNEMRSLFKSYIEHNNDSIFLIFECDEHRNKGKLLGFTIITPMNLKRWEMFKNGKINSCKMPFEYMLGSNSAQKAAGLLLHSLAYPIDKNSSQEEKMIAGDILQACLAVHLSVLMERWFIDGDDTLSLMYCCNDKKFNKFFADYNTNSKGETLEGGRITVVESKAASIKVA